MSRGMKALVQSGIAAAMLIAAGLASHGQNVAVSRQRDQAFALEQQGRNTEAEEAWRGILKSEPGDAEAWAHLGFLEARQGRYREAISLYRRAAALKPSMPDLQLNLGLALFKAGELKEATRVFAPLLKKTPPVSPDAQRLRILLGMAYYGSGDYAAAIPLLKDAMARDPQDLPYRLVLAQSCLRAEQYPCVLDVYRQILALNAESAEADMLAGEALDGMQDHAGAIRQFRAAVQADPKQPEVHFGLGYLLWRQSQYEEAARQFQTELDNVPEDAEAVAYLADCERQLNHPEMARPLAEKAIRMNPRSAMPYMDLGILDAEAGSTAGALREFRMAAQLEPASVQVHWRLARLYQTMGKQQQAKAEFDLTRKLNHAADETVARELDAAQARNAAEQKAVAASPNGPQQQ